MNPLRFALVGCGSVVARHAQALQALAETQLVAVCDVDPGRAAAFAERHQVRPAFALEALLGLDEVDAVTVCVPTLAHAEVALAVAKSGRHVLVEKPIAADLAQAHTLVQECARRRQTLSVVAQNRFAADVRWLERLAREGWLGRPISVHAQSQWSRDQAYYEAAPGRGRRDAREGGVLANQAVHVLDLLLWLFGPARAVHAARATLTHSIAVEDTAALVLSLASGAIATLETSTSIQSPLGEGLEARFERGSVRLWGGRVESLTTAPGIECEPPPSHAASTASTSPPSLFELLYADFAAAVRDSREPLVTPAQSLHVLEVIETAYRTAPPAPIPGQSQARTAAG